MVLSLLRLSLSFVNYCDYGTIISELMDHFWEITEYLLNTLLFTLGGTVWGDVSVIHLLFKY